MALRSRRRGLLHRGAVLCLGALPGPRLGGLHAQPQHVGAALVAVTTPPFEPLLPDPRLRYADFQKDDLDGIYGWIHGHPNAWVEELGDHKVRVWLDGPHAAEMDL